MPHPVMMMEFGISDTPILKPRRFDKVDILTGTPDIDTFEVLRDGQVGKNANDIYTTQGGADIYTTGGGADTFKTHLINSEFYICTPDEGCIPNENWGKGKGPSLDDKMIYGKDGNDIFTTQGGQGGADTFKTHLGHVTIKDFTPNEGDKLLVLTNEEPSLSNSSEIEILVYQEQERTTYLERFQAPIAHSYTYIDDFDLIEDEIIVGGIPYVIEIDKNDIPMLTDDIQPAFGM